MHIKHKWTGALAAVLTLGACDHATGVQPRPSPQPDPALVQAAIGLEPAELALLLRMAERMEQAVASGAIRFPATHPLDGVSDAQIRELSAISGIPIERLLAGPAAPCDSFCGRTAGAR
jgi:hypothetical protein